MLLQRGPGRWLRRDSTHGPPCLHRPPGKEVEVVQTPADALCPPPLRCSCWRPEEQAGDSRPSRCPGHPGQGARHPSAALGGGGPGCGLPSPHETALPPHQGQAWGPRHLAELCRSLQRHSSPKTLCTGSHFLPGGRGDRLRPAHRPGRDPTRSFRCPLRAVAQGGTGGALPARAHRPVSSLHRASAARHH